MLESKLTLRLKEKQDRLKMIDEQKRTWWVRSWALYPTAMFFLLIFSTAASSLALQNTFQLFIGIKDLPPSTRVSI